MKWINVYKSIKQIFFWKFINIYVNKWSQFIISLESQNYNDLKKCPVYFVIVYDYDLWDISYLF